MIFYFIVVENMSNIILIIIVSIISIAVLIITTILVVKAHKEEVVTGFEGMIGVEAEAIENFENNKGHVLVRGEIWTGISEDDIKENDTVIVVSVKGMRLSVKKINN